MSGAMPQGVTGREYTIRDLFGKQYLLEHYQREYTWETRHVHELIADLTRCFLNEWKPDHDRARYEQYRPYFLGAFVCHPASGLRRSLVDGQQRFTTVHLLLIHLERWLTEQAELRAAATVGQLISQYAGGIDNYTIDIPERHPCLEALRAGDVFDISGSSVSVRNLWDRAQDIAVFFPQELRDNALPNFVDWLLHRVFLVEINAADRNHGWEIFESMNDRGAAPTPLDMLKGFLLSRVHQEQAALNEAWRGMLTSLIEFDRRAPSDFIKALLVARYAPTDGTANDDIERAFHEWVRLDPRRVGLHRQGQDYRDFILKIIVPSAKQYKLLCEASARRVPGLEEIFYNASNGLDSQRLLILAATQPSDSMDEFTQKARLVARYFDLMFARRAANNGAVQSHDFNDEAQRLLPAVRDAAHSLQTLRQLLGREAADLVETFDGIEKLSLHSNRRQIRYLLARLTAFVEVSCGNADRADRYLGFHPTATAGESERVAPWEIEHIWSNKYELHLQAGLPNERAFQQQRNRLGALLLLDKPDNASFGADTYLDKLVHYQRHNLLAASLHPDVYRRNPKFQAFLSQRDLEELMTPYPDGFDTAAIDARAALYRHLCQLIWDTDKLGFVAPDSTTAPKKKQPRGKTYFGVSIADLMRVGMITEGQPLRGELKRSKEYFHATVLDGGDIKLASGEVFGSLSGAGAAVLGLGSCPGWNFWHVANASGEWIRLTVVRKQAIERGLLAKEE